MQSVNTINNSNKRKEGHTVDASVAILVSFPDHLINLIIGQLLADRRHDMSQLGGGDEAIVVAIKNLESLCKERRVNLFLPAHKHETLTPNLLLAVGVLHFAGHHGEELGKVNRSIVVSVNLVDHVLQL